MSEKQSPRVVWITGASSGIGKALAEVFLAKGDIVVASSRSLAKLKVQRRIFYHPAAPLEVFRCDVKRETDIKRVARLILKRHKKIDIVINNAGVTAFKELVQTSTSEFDDIVATNLRSLFLTSRAVLPAMLKRRSGTILNILSYAAKTTYTKSAAYSAAKSGAEALMNVLRAEVRHKGIKVINVYPGAVLTPIWSSGNRKRYAASMMPPLEIASLVYQLTRQPNSLHVEEIVVRPPQGDLQV